MGLVSHAILSQKKTQLVLSITQTMHGELSRLVRDTIYAITNIEGFEVKFKFNQDE